MSYDHYDALSNQPRWGKKRLNRFPEGQTRCVEEDKIYIIPQKALTAQLPHCEVCIWNNVCGGNSLLCSSGRQDTASWIQEFGWGTNKINAPVRQALAVRCFRYANDIAIRTYYIQSKRLENHCSWSVVKSGRDVMVSPSSVDAGSPSYARVLIRFLFDTDGVVNPPIISTTTTQANSSRKRVG